MKAWMVSWGDPYDGCILIHAETRGKAMHLGQNELDCDVFIEMRAVRIKGLDDKPITYQNADDVGFHYTDPEHGDEDGYMLPEHFTNYCECDICKGGKCTNQTT